MQAGAKEVYIGDLNSEEAAAEAMTGVDTVYYICNTANPREDEIGFQLIETAKKDGKITFVYHSVMHSLLTDMQHHKKKLAVEKALVDIESIFSELTGRMAQAAYISDENFLATLHKSPNSYEGKTLLAMFKHYNENSFCGNAFTLAHILRRSPVTVREYLNDAPAGRIIKEMTFHGCLPPQDCWNYRP